MLVLLEVKWAIDLNKDSLMIRQSPKLEISWEVRTKMKLRSQIRKMRDPTRQYQNQFLKAPSESSQQARQHINKTVQRR